MENITLVGVNYLRIIPQNTRRLFFYMILSISIVALIGNVMALKSILTRKIKYLQKACIVSLAIADILSVLLFGINNLEALSKELKTWSLGSFLCYLIPMGQVLGTTASSFSLLVIALDRYQNLNMAIGKKWNPNILNCTFIILILWISSTVTSCPMLWMFEYLPIYIVYTDGIEPVYEKAHMCLSVVKEPMMLYYTLIACIIFFPLILVFSWFHFRIAAIIWKHRTPHSTAVENESSSKESLSSCESNPEQKVVKKKCTKNVQVERKIRTFKIIIVLLLAFVLCRLPYWVFFVVKLARTISSDLMWNIQFSLISLNLLNCALNPFLYTFLNQSITALEAIKKLAKKILSCCCCFTNSEFDEFTKYNPFEIDYGLNKKQANFTQRYSKNVDVKCLNLVTFPSISLHVTQHQ